MIIVVTGCGIKNVETDEKMQGDSFETEEKIFANEDTITENNENEIAYETWIANDWEEDESAVGYNLGNRAISTEGNGCIYTRDMGLYGGKSEEEGECYSIYRLKNEKWELFVSHPITEEDSWTVEEKRLYNLTYYKGYIYYILLRDSEVGMGHSGKDYSICRASEEDGTVEELVKCNGNFFIYQDEIYYETLENSNRWYFRMKLDGSDRQLIYFDDPKDYRQFTYTVGGGCLYLKKEERIMGISLETGKIKFFETFATNIDGIFYERGNLYLVDNVNDVIYQLDARTGNETKILELEGHFEWGSLWIHNGCLYYVEWEPESEENCRDFKVLDLTTGEIITWNIVSFDNARMSTHLEVVGNHILIRFIIWNENDTAYEYGYFEKEISEMIETE